MVGWNAMYNDVQAQMKEQRERERERVAILAQVSGTGGSCPPPGGPPGLEPDAEAICRRDSPTS